MDSSVSSSVESPSHVDCNVGGCFRRPFSSSFCGRSSSCFPGSSATRLRPINVDNDSEEQQLLGQRMLLKEVTEMNAQERQKAYEDVHGVRDQVQETPQLLQEGLAAMRQSIVEITQSRSTKKGVKALQRSHFLVPCRVLNESFLVKFLRCEEYNVQRAVERYIRFHEVSFKFFGLNGILHDCLQEDLDKEDLEFLRKGSIMPLWDARDRSGRLVYLFYTNRADFKDPDYFMKAAYYLFLKGSHDLEVQKNGVVLLAWCLNNGRESFVPPIYATAIRDSAAILAAMPLRISCVHFCYEGDLGVMSLLEYTLQAVGRTGRIRSRRWRGSITECKYNLMSFGIDASNLPLDTEGTLQVESFLAWLEEEARTEMIEREQSDGAILPNTRDVLLGRGLPIRTFPGNVALGKMVQDSWAAYEALPPYAKTTLYQQILDRLDGRILHRQAADQPWFVAPEKMALHRMSKSFRNKPTVEQYHATKKSHGS